MTEHTTRHRLIPDGSGDSTDTDPDDEDANSPDIDGENGQNGESEDRKVKTVMIELSPEEYDQLTDTKETFGFTWKGMLLRAHRSLHKDDCK